MLRRQGSGVDHPHHASLKLRAVLASFLIGTLVAGPACALPQDDRVTSGQATISQVNPKTLRVNQVSDKVIINWRGFSINANELVRFLQPSATSVAVNQVVGGAASVILGQLTANGRLASRRAGPCA